MEKKFPFSFTNVYFSICQDMEAEVNIHFTELISNKSNEQLLTNQVQRLLMCLDVYLETEGSNTSIEGPIEFAKEKIFPRFARYVCLLFRNLNDNSNHFGCLICRDN